MRYAAVNDVYRIHAAFGGIECAADLGQHTAADGAVCEQAINLAGAQVGQQLTRFVQHTVLVSNTSFSALSTVANLDATTSALML